MAKKNNKTAFFAQVASEVQGGDSSMKLNISHPNPNPETETEEEKQPSTEVSTEILKRMGEYTEQTKQPHTAQKPKKGVEKKSENFIGSIQVGSVTITPDQLNEVSAKMLEINDKKCNVRIHQAHDRVLNLLAQSLPYEHNLAKSAVTKTALVYWILENALKDVEV